MLVICNRSDRTPQADWLCRGLSLSGSFPGESYVMSVVVKPYARAITAVLFVSTLSSKLGRVGWRLIE